DNIERNVSKNIRLFSFGVGYDVDTFLLDSLAQAHHGSSTYVRPGERLDELVSAFYAKISTPVLTDLELDFGDMQVYDLYPQPLPDLFSGSQIVVVGRYRDGGTETVTLQGMVNQELQTFTFDEQTFRHDSRLSGKDTLETLPRLWATRKIGYLLTQVRLQGPDQETIDQIVQLSIRYGIVTPYTSYLVTEPLSLGAVEQERIAPAAMGEALSESNAPTYGQAAVEAADDQGALADAEAPAELRGIAADIIRNVGSRTFIFTEGMWVDTAFDPDSMEVIQVAFLSDDYFALAETIPELAAAFSLGSQVIAFYDGVVYQVVSDSQEVQAIDIPSPAISPSDEDVPPLGQLPEDKPIENNCLYFPLSLIILPLLLLIWRRKW
ncbi:MAG: hypothetical protein N2C13_02755, partial [Chloroflexota bacterium]